MNQGIYEEMITGIVSKKLNELDRSHFFWAKETPFSYTFPPFLLKPATSYFRCDSR